MHPTNSARGWIDGRQRGLNQAGYLRARQHQVLLHEGDRAENESEYRVHVRGLRFLPVGAIRQSIRRVEWVTSHGSMHGLCPQCSQNDEEKYTYIIASLKGSPIRHTDRRLAKRLRPKAYGTRYRISSTLCLATSKFVGEGTRCFSS